MTEYHVNLRNTAKPWERSNPFQAIYGYRNPYFIIGNLATQRNAFIVVGVFSAPDGFIERNAINQQMSLL